MEEKSATRERILDAATQRIMHYGLGKTTMAEIAADCSMSAGNIYRFFEAKIDIAEAIARKFYAQEQAELAAIARRKDKAADWRLREIFLHRLRHGYSLLAKDGKILEIAEVLHRERPLFANEQLALERVFISAVLREGQEARLFGPHDPEFTAEMLQSATMKFSVPQLFSRLTLPKLERELNGVFDILLRGLYRRGDETDSQGRDQ